MQQTFRGRALPFATPQRPHQGRMTSRRPAGPEAFLTIRPPPLRRKNSRAISHILRANNTTFANARALKAIASSMLPANALRQNIMAITGLIDEYVAIKRSRNVFEMARMNSTKRELLERIRQASRSSEFMKIVAGHASHTANTTRMMNALVKLKSTPNAQMPNANVDVRALEALNLVLFMYLYTHTPRRPRAYA